MTEPPDLRSMLGEDAPDAELERLQHVDDLLRAVPAPPAEIPSSLARKLVTIPATAAARPKRQRIAALALAAAFAAAIAGAFFGIGYAVRGDEFDTRRTVVMRPTEYAPGAAATISLGSRDERSGNWEFTVDVEGLPTLRKGGYYVLWLARDGEYAATCGTFNAGPGPTSVRMSASYRLADYDEWVVTAHRPGRSADPAPWLLRAPTS